MRVVVEVGYFVYFSFDCWVRVSSTTSLQYLLVIYGVSFGVRAGVVLVPMLEALQAGVVA